MSILEYLIYINVWGSISEYFYINKSLGGVFRNKCLEGEYFWERRESMLFVRIIGKGLFSRQMSNHLFSNMNYSCPEILQRFVFLQKETIATFGHKLNLPLFFPSVKY